MITYDVSKDPKYWNGCVIFSTITAWSNLHTTTLSYDQIDEVYVAIGRWRWDGGIQAIDTPKIIKHLDKSYWTKTYIWLPYDDDWTTQKVERNLRKWHRWILWIRINKEFHQDCNDWVMNSSERTNHKTTVWHCLSMYDNWNRYLVDIFSKRKVNQYMIPKNLWKDIRKCTNSFFTISK